MSDANSNTSRRSTLRKRCDTHDSRLAAIEGRLVHLGERVEQMIAALARVETTFVLEESLTRAAYQQVVYEQDAFKQDLNFLTQSCAQTDKRVQELDGDWM